MTQHERRWLPELRSDLGRLAADVREMAALRWELARRELAADAAAARRLAITVAVAAAMATAVLPLAAGAVAWCLDGRLGIPLGGWLAIFSAAFLAAAAALVLLAWRRFRKQLVALAQTREELREDMVWLEEFFERED